MSPEQLEMIGKAIYPTPAWKSCVARMLGVTTQTVRRWALGAGVPDDYHHLILKKAEDQCNVINNALYELKGFKK